MKKLMIIPLLLALSGFMSGCYTQLGTYNQDDATSTQKETETVVENREQPNVDSDTLQLANQTTIINNYYDNDAFIGYRRYFRTYYPSSFYGFSTGTFIYTPSYGFCDPYYPDYYWWGCYPTTVWVGYTPWWAYNYWNYGYGYGWGGYNNHHHHNNDYYYGGITRTRNSELGGLRTGLGGIRSGNDTRGDLSGSRATYSVKNDDPGSRKALPPITKGSPKDLAGKNDNDLGAGGRTTVTTSNDKKGNSKVDIESGNGRTGVKEGTFSETNPGSGRATLPPVTKRNDDIAKSNGKLDPSEGSSGRGNVTSNSKKGDNKNDVSDEKKDGWGGWNDSWNSNPNRSYSSKDDSRKSSQTTNSDRSVKSSNSNDRTSSKSSNSVGNNSSRDKSVSNDAGSSSRDTKSNSGNSGRTNSSSDRKSNSKPSNDGEKRVTKPQSNSNGNSSGSNSGSSSRPSYSAPSNSGSGSSGRSSSSGSSSSSGRSSGGSSSSSSSSGSSSRSGGSRSR